MGCVDGVKYVRLVDRGLSCDFLKEEVRAEILFLREASGMGCLRWMDKDILFFREASGIGVFTVDGQGEFQKRVFFVYSHIQSGWNPALCRVTPTYSCSLIP